MANKSYAGLKAIITEKLEALNGADDTKLFEHVYGVNETEPEGSPYCFVVEKTGGGTILDTHRNEREWQFDIFIQVEISENRTPEQAYDALLDAADRTIQMFDQDPMLFDEHGQEQCKWVRVVPAEFSFGTQDTGFHRAQLTVAVVDIVNRYAN